MHVTVSYSEPWHTRPANRKIFALAGIAIVVIAGVAAIATYPSWGGAEAAHAETGERLSANRVAVDSPTFSIASVSGAPGTPLTVPIQLAGAEGLGGASVRLAYDPAVVRVLSVTNGDLASSTLTWRHDVQNGVLAMLLTTSAQTGVNGAGTYAIVTLEAVDGAMGTSTPLTLSVTSATTAAHDVITAKAASGSFRNGIPGDVSGDGIVDRADYDLLSRWLVGEDVKILKLNADLDDDGAITDVDAIILHQRTP